MSTPKRLTPQQLMDAAKYLVATNQLGELMACMALEQTADLALNQWDRNSDDEDNASDDTCTDTLTVLAQSFAYESWFHYANFNKEIEDAIATFAPLYLNNR